MLFFKSKDEINNIITFLHQFMIYKNESKGVNEIFSILVYLYANYKLEKFNFPFILTKRESPDFSMLCFELNEAKGIEHTLSTLQNYKMAESELQKRPDGSKLEPDYYSPFNKLSKYEINKGLRKPSDKLTGEPYLGDRPEIEWAKTIKDTIHNKTGLLNKNHFEKFATNELIVQSHTPVEILIKLTKALKYLEPHIRSYHSSTYKVKYDKIHIISKHSFIYNILNQNEIVDFSRKKLL